MAMRLRAQSDAQAGCDGNDVPELLRVLLVVRGDEDILLLPI